MRYLSHSKRQAGPGIGNGLAAGTFRMNDGQAAIRNGRRHSNPKSIEDLPFPPYDLSILRSLRKIIRAIDHYSHQLMDIYGLTVPQLICLSAIFNNKRLTAIELARFVHISPSTLVGILDRLELKHLIKRQRNLSDRRQIFISVTPMGRKTVSHAPSPLQASLADGLHKLPVKERASISRSLNRVVDLMEAGHLDAAPLLVLDRGNFVKREPRRSGARLAKSR